MYHRVNRFFLRDLMYALEKRTRDRSAHLNCQSSKSTSSDLLLVFPQPPVVSVPLPDALLQR